jgi:hypothetical protein
MLDRLGPKIARAQPPRWTYTHGVEEAARLRHPLVDVNREVPRHNQHTNVAVLSALDGLLGRLPKRTSSCYRIPPARPDHRNVVFWRHLP